MGGERGGKANGGYGKGGNHGWKPDRDDYGHKGSGRSRWPKNRENRENRHSRNGWAETEGWATHDYGQVETAPSKLRLLAAQFRFFTRVLRRHAPEERVWAAEQQLQVGDHILVQWECSEQHGIVCSTSNRRGHSGHGDAPWVMFWSGDRLQSSTLPKFIHGGELHRIVYPLWACRCSSDFSSTTMPEILAEDFCEAAAPEVTVRLASEAQRTWRPSWTLSADLEFCLYAKLGGRTPMWEIHRRQAFSSKEGLVPGHPLGCLMRGKPSELLTGAAPAATTGNPRASPEPRRGAVQETRYPVQLAKEPWIPPAMPMEQVPFAHQQVPQMSATAEAFVPSMQPWVMPPMAPMAPMPMAPMTPMAPMPGGAPSPTAPDDTIYQ